MKRLLALTLCLIATGGAFEALADKCDYLRNRPQDYQECRNGWDGTSNRSNAPTPWWKNYDPDAGSDSGAAEQPQPYRPYVAPYVPPDPRVSERRERGMAQAASLSEQGVALNEARRFEEAVPFHRQALDLVRQYDSNGDNQAKGAYNLGLTLLEIKQYAEAETLFRDALAIRERGVDLDRITNNHSSALEPLYLTIENLAAAIEGQGQYERAEPLRKRVYELRQKSQSVDHMDTWLAYRRLHANREAQPQRVIQNKSSEFSRQGAALYAVGKYAEAAAAFREAMKLEQQVANNAAGDTERLELAYYNLGMSLLNTKGYAEAETLLKQALALRENDPAIKLNLAFYGSSVASLDNRLHGLAKLHASQKKHAEAEPYLRRIFELQERTRGPDAPETLASLNNLGVNLHEQKRYDEAEALYKRGLALAEKGKGTTARAELRENLATLQRNRAASAPAPAQSASTQPNKLESEWETGNKQLKIHNAEAGRAYNTRQYDQAIVHGRAALALAQKHGIAVGDSQYDLAIYYRAAQQPAEAETLFKQAIETFEKSRPENLGSVKPLFDLATLYDQQKRFADSEPLYTRALAILDKNRLGASKTLALPIVKSLSRLYRDTQRTDEARQLEERYGNLLAGK